MNSTVLTLVLLVLAHFHPQSQAGVITGSILSGEGMPARGVRVAAVAVSDTERAGGASILVSIGETDASGEYRLENIPPGRYRVSAGPLAIPTFFPGTLTVDTATILTVSPGAVMDRVSFALKGPMPGRVVLDFENFGAMTFFSRNPIPPHARLSDAFLYTNGVRFSSGSPFVAVIENGVGHAASGKNGIGGSTPEGMLTYERAFPVVARFFDPHNPLVPATTDFVSVKGDLWGSGQPIVLNAFDADGKKIGSTTTVDDGLPVMIIAVPGIHRVEFLGTQDDGGVGLDDFTFNPVVPVKR